MKQFIFSSLLIFGITAVSCNSLKNNEFEIEDAKNIALNLTSAIERRRMNVDYYYEGKMRILSIPDEIVTGIDFEEDGIFDLYFFLQADVELKIDEEIENGQIMIARTSFIVNNTEHDFIKCFTLGKEDEKAHKVLKKIPKKIQKRLIGNTIEGFGIGHIENTEEYGKFFNKK